MGVALPSSGSASARLSSGLSGTTDWSTFDERIKAMGFVLEEFFEGVEVDVRHVRGPDLSAEEAQRYDMQPEAV